MIEQNNIHRLEEDEIDLKELFKTIAKKKKFIFIFTTAITTLAIIYSLLATPIFSGKAILEIGYFSTEGKKEYIDDSNRLTKELNIIFIDSVKNLVDEKKDASIESVSTLKGNKNFIEIVAEGLNNDVVTNEINSVITHIQTKHKKIIDEKIQKVAIQINSAKRELNQLETNQLVSLDERISLVKEFDLPLLAKRIKILSSDITMYNNQLKITEQNIKETQNNNPAVSALNIMEKRDLENRISDMKVKTLDLENSQQDILKNKLPQLLRDREKLLTVNKIQLDEKIELLQYSIAPHNYTNTKVVAKIITSEYPIKPKKKLIVAVAFVTGLILSIFLVFFIEFLKGMKEEDE